MFVVSYQVIPFADSPIVSQEFDDLETAELKADILRRQGLTGIIVARFMGEF